MAAFYLLLYENKYKDLYSPVPIVAGCFVLVALVLSLFLTYQHLRSYTNPSEQKWIVAVIFMVPVYATESILSLWNTKLSLACDILRNCYEAFALYSFGSYLIACLGGEMKVIELLEDESRKEISKPLLEGDENSKLQRRTFRNFILHPSALGKDLFTMIKFGLVQYMILKAVCALLALILELFGMYGDGEFKWCYGYPYITIVLNFSQMWALYCLVQFYNVTHQRLEAIKPLSKFISFKAIVFATWWQGVSIVLLCHFGVLLREGKFQTGLQDFLICIEMAVAAIAHIFVFSAKPYHFIPASEDRELPTQKTQAVLKIEEGDEEKPALIEKRETEVKAPGTSVKESVQDIVVEGGQKVVKDVVLTINQAIEPVHEGMTKIQETFHQISVSGNGRDEPEAKVEEHEENITVESEV
ncbi:LAZ1 homolog 2 [Olea europaea subsp. europaea]|uniref:LAZ1 homolog 2 n=1 Tax=Olea europaea subsp. europaea TaxID=158383 RepID=A0A8S0TEI6_OLEEU|nr:LAZ1 homolog 2 [Olea europaea subsp. europaea]